MTPAFGNHHTQSCAARRIGRATQKGNIVRRQPQYDSLGITPQLCKAWRMKASAPSLRVVSAQPQYGSTRPPRPTRQQQRKAGELGRAAGRESGRKYVLRPGGDAASTKKN